MSEISKSLEEISPFFSDINKYDDSNVKSAENEMVGKISNRSLDKEWNIKIQIGVDFFNETFNFIKEMGFNTIFGITRKRLRIYKLSVENTHLTYINIDKTEISEFINKDLDIEDLDIEELDENKESDENKKSDEKEIIIYVDFDILDEISLNNKYPLDIYFDTKKNKTMYIINGKTLESRRLNDIDTENDSTISSYNTYYNKLIKFMKHEETFNIIINYVSFRNVLMFLDKKKTKKDKSSTRIVNIEFNTSEIDFKIENEIKSSSIKMYGDDIIARGIREVLLILEIDMLAKFGKLKLSNNVIFYINEKFPFIIETQFGAGRIKLYYLIAPRSKQEE